METVPVPVPSGAEQPSAPLFEVRQVMTEELYTAYYKAHMRAQGTGRSLTVCSALIGAVGLLLVVMELLDVSQGLWAYGVAGMVLCAGFLLLRVYLPRLSAKNLLKTTQELSGEQEAVLFYDEAFVEDSPQGRWPTSYSKLSQVVETDRLLLLYQNKFQAAVIDKPCFTKGTPEELVRFLCGGGRLPYQRMK